MTANLQYKQPTTPTIRQLLLSAVQQLARASESAQLDAEILLAHVLDRPRTWLRTWPEYTVSQSDHNAYQKIITQRQSGVPVAYLAGKRDFWLHCFQVCPDVLIPRPDTELLVELALKIIPADKPYAILELGTGSGIISISLGAERPASRITATDISAQALSIAGNNAESIGVPNIDFVQGNWFSGLDGNAYDFIISNPPYVEENDPHLYQGDVRFEPRMALSSGHDGLRDIRVIASQARDYLADNAYLAIEHGYNQADAVKRILSEHQYTNIKNHRDLQNNPRVTIAQYPKPNQRLK